MRAGAEGDKREVGTIFDFAGHARAFFRILTEGVAARKYKGETFQKNSICSGRNYIFPALCIAAPKSRCPCCFAVHARLSINGRCTLHFSQCCCGDKIDLNAPGPSCSVECHAVNHECVRVVMCVLMQVVAPKRISCWEKYGKMIGI